MEKRLKDYTAYLEALIASDDTSAMSIIYSDITVQIGFFQHERIVHLIVTVTFAILALMSLWFFTMTQMTDSVYIIHGASGTVHKTLLHT